MNFRLALLLIAAVATQACQQASETTPTNDAPAPSTAAPAPTEPEPTAAQALAAALANANRSAEDTARDAGRKPAEVLAFAGVKPGMTVMDVMAASGWYTEVLSAAVGPEGVVYAENPRWLLNAMNGAPDKALTERLDAGRLINVVRADADLEDGLIPAGSVDVALTALNYHDTYYMSGEMPPRRRCARSTRP